MHELEPTSKNFPDDLVELVSPFDFATTLESLLGLSRKRGSRSLRRSITHKRHAKPVFSCRRPWS